MTAQLKRGHNRARGYWCIVNEVVEAALCKHQIWRVPFSLRYVEITWLLEKVKRNNKKSKWLFSHVLFFCPIKHSYIQYLTLKLEHFWRKLLNCDELCFDALKVMHFDKGNWIKQHCFLSSSNQASYFLSKLKNNFSFAILCFKLHSFPFHQ